MILFIKKLVLVVVVVVVFLMVVIFVVVDGEKYILVSYVFDSDSWWNIIKNGIVLVGD